MQRLIRIAATLLLLGACAHMTSPPGGPADKAAPRLISIYPDSVRVLEGFKGNAEFRFNEIVSEGGSPNFGHGNGDLEKLILLSPDSLVPHVEWHRDRITVRPRNGWRPNTVYRIELMPGVRDLSSNEDKTAAMITFATGGTTPTRVLLGRAIDWTTQRSAPSVLIEAMHLPDRLVYRTVSDSLGRFHLESLPAGEYLVGATLDKNRDLRRNRDESWDTVRVAVGATETGEIWMFPRDSAAPRAQQVDRADSTWAVFTLTQPVRPDFITGTDSIRVVHLPDSSNVGPLNAMSEAIFDSLHPQPPPRPATADSTAKPDSTAKADSLPPPVTRAVVKPAKPAGEPRDTTQYDAPAGKRPPLNNKLYVHTSGRFQDGQKYWIAVRGVTTARGLTGTASLVLTLPEVKSTAKKDSTAKADSTAKKPATATPDSTARKPAVVKPDSTAKKPGGGGDR